MDRDDIRKADIARLDAFGAAVYHHLSERDAQMLTVLLSCYLAGMDAWYDEEKQECQWCGQPGEGGSRVTHLPNCPVRWLREHYDTLNRLKALLPWPDIRAPG